MDSQNIRGGGDKKPWRLGEQRGPSSQLMHGQSHHARSLVAD